MYNGSPLADTFAVMMCDVYMCAIWYVFWKEVTYGYDELWITCFGRAGDKVSLAIIVSKGTSIE